MKVKFLVVVLLFSSLLFISSKGQGESIIIYSSAEQFRNEEMQTQLEENFPNLDIKVMYIPTGKAAAKIMLEGERTEADIVVGLETSYMKKISTYLEDIAGISRIPYLEEFKADVIGNKYVIWERQAGAFIVNESTLKKYGAEVPLTYEDLLHEQYKDLIAMPDPKSSGTGYFFLKNRINTLGFEEGFEYFKKLEPNIKQFTESGSGPLKLLNQGEVGIGLALTFQAVNEINLGKPYSIIFPPEGSPYSLTGTGMIKGRNSNENIQDVFDFIVNDFFLYDKSHFSPEQVYIGQENLIKNYPSNINYADMTGIEDINEKERILRRWEY